MGDSLDNVNWAALEHNYGKASDLPDLLRACASPNPDTVSTALAEVYTKLYHQGGWVCSAAAAALPWLTDLAASSATRHRLGVIELVELLAREAVSVGPVWVDSGWRPALAAMRPQLLALLDDPDVKVRREAILLVADGIQHPDAVTALRHRLAVETDRVTRADLILAFGVVYDWSRDEALCAELVTLLDDDDLQFRLAAVHALAETDPTIAAKHVDTMVEALLDPGAALWALSAWVDGSPATMINETRRLLADDPAASFALEFAFDRHHARHAAAMVQAQEAIGGPPPSDPDVDARVATAANAVQVLSQWRESAPTLSVVAGLLDDTEPTVRYRAAALLACLGPKAAPYADELLALTTDSTLYDSWKSITVGDAAVWALARQDHADCLPALVERLSGDRLGFDTAHLYYARDVHRLVQPAASDVLIPLRHHADVLLDPLISRRDRAFAPQLCEVVAAWGPIAAKALPVLVDLVADEKLRPLAAKAIGSLGSDAAEAAKTMRDKASEPAVAWALWRTGADPDLGVAELTRQVEAEPSHQTIALLADLGPEAAASTEIVRGLTDSTDSRIRAEAAHALWRITGDRSVTVLTELAEPLAAGECSLAGMAALRHLATIGVTNDRVLAIAQSITDSPRRIAHFGGWRAFTEDEDIRAAALALLG
jgi:HEAT repeat protein